MPKRARVHKPTAKAKKMRTRWHHLYNNDTWRATSKTYLEANPICCLCQERPADAVDHIIPHRGDVELFNDVNNWQPYCSICHGSKSRQERIN